MNSPGKRSEAWTMLKNQFSRIMEHRPKNRGVYASYVLKGLIPDLSCFSVSVILYQFIKVLFAIFYAANVLPKISLYFMTSSSLLLFYLPVSLTTARKFIRLTNYLTCVIILQVVCLATGSVFVYYEYYKPGIKESKLSVINVTIISMAVEWVFVLVTLVTRGFVALVYFLFVFLLKGTIKLICSLFRNKQKQAVS